VYSSQTQSCYVPLIACYYSVRLSGYAAIAHLTALSARLNRVPKAAQFQRFAAKNSSTCPLNDVPTINRQTAAKFDISYSEVRLHGLRIVINKPHHTIKIKCCYNFNLFLSAVLSIVCISETCFALSFLRVSRRFSGETASCT